MYTRRLAILPLIILLALVAFVAFVPSPALAHQAAARAAVPDHFGRAQAQTEIGPDAVWRPTDSQMEELWTCFENPTCSPSLVMGVFDAPAAAIDFNQSRPAFEFLVSFEELGPVDLGEIYLPQTNYLRRFEMLNGDPPVVASDSIGFVDMSAIPEYAPLLAQYPNATLWPVATAGRGETVAGGQRFIFTYPLVDGCHACENLGTGQVAFNFDAAGNYLGLTHLGPLSAETTPTPPSPPAALHPPRQIAFVQDGNIRLIQDDGGNEQQITHSGADCCLAWSPDGQRLYFIRQAKTKDDPESAPSGLIMAYDFPTGSEQTFTVPAEIDVSNALAVSPDGGSLAFSSTAWTDVEQFGYVHEGCLYVLNLASGETVLVDCAAPGAYYDIAYAPDGSLAVELGQYEGSHPAIYASPTAERQDADEICCYDMEYSADGADLYTVGGGYGSSTSDLRVYRAGATGPQVLQVRPVEEGSYSNPDLSPEGDRLAYAQGGMVHVMDLASLATTPLTTGHWPAWRPAQATPAMGDLLGRKEATFAPLETTAYETSAGVLFPEPAAVFNETAAKELVATLRAAAPAAITPERAAAFERLVMQQETLVPLLDDYTILAGDQADVAVDLAGIVSGTTLLGIKARSNPVAAIGDLLKKAVEDFIKLLLHFIDDEALREGTSNGISLAIETIGVVDGTIEYDDAVSLGEEFLERTVDDGVRALAFNELIPAFAGPVQPVLDQGIRSASGAGQPAWGVADPVEAAALGLDGLTTQSALMRELAHDVYANSLGRGRDVNEFLKDVTDLALLGTRNPIGLIFSVQTRLQQLLIDAAATSVLSEAMTCTREAALASGDFAFQPDRPVFGCEVPVPLNLGDFFDRLLSDGRKTERLGRMKPAAQASPELAAALAGYRAALDGLQSALNAADATEVQARAAELSAAAQTFEQHAAPVLARLGPADGADAEGQMALGTAITLVRLDAAFALLAADEWLADPAAADSVALGQVLTAAAAGGDRLSRVLAQVPLSAPPDAALPVVDGPGRIFVAAGETTAIPFRIVNAGGQPFAAAVLTLESGGQTLAEVALSNLEPGEATEVTVAWTPPAAGIHSLTARASDGEQSDWRTLMVVATEPQSPAPTATAGDPGGATADSVPSPWLILAAVAAAVAVVALAALVIRRRG